MAIFTATDDSGNPIQTSATFSFEDNTGLVMEAPATALLFVIFLFKSKKG